MMKRRAFLLTALIFISAPWTVTSKETQPKRDGAISGRVMGDDGQPLAGAQVISFGVGKLPMAGGMQMTNCDAEGNFKVPGLQHGVYMLMVRSPGYVFNQNQSRK